MKEITIKDKYKLLMDDKEVTLQIKKLVTPKDESKDPYLVWKDHGYYSTVAGSLKAIVELDIRESESLSEMVNRIDEMKRYFDEKLKLKDSQ